MDKLDEKRTFFFVAIGEEKTWSEMIIIYRRKGKRERTRRGRILSVVCFLLLLMTMRTMFENDLLEKKVHGQRTRHARNDRLMK